jgi:hypothetical protein
MPPQRISAFILTLSCLALAPWPAHAHRFAERYDLPVPLWLYLAGAAAAVALTFVALAVFARAAPGSREYPAFNLLRLGPARALAHPAAVGLSRMLAVAVFTLALAAGFFGSQEPKRNILPTLVWVLWWVGLAYVSALVGNAWALLNPWKAAFAWAEALFRRLAPGRELSLRLPYPDRLGAWPAVLLLCAFAWMELVWPLGQDPSSLACAALLYSVLTWAGMLLFGREAWLRVGEAFSVMFSLLARFAPTEVGIASPGICAACSSPRCRRKAGPCVDCQECFERAALPERRWNIRPYAVGLVADRPLHPSLLGFVLVMLATVTYDGLKETDLLQRWINGVFYLPGARSVLPALARMTGDVMVALHSALLVLFLTLAVLTYLAVSGLAAAMARTPPSAATGGPRSPRGVARLFVLSLLPIAIAYHLAHYLSYLLINGQLVVPLLSDPFGFGWNLFGTADVRPDIGVVGARFAWYASVIAIVAGHMLAVYVAHSTAWRSFGDARLVFRSQVPMVALMIGYTTLSLWILAQPIVE